MRAIVEDDRLVFDSGEPSKMDELVVHHKERLRDCVGEAWRLLQSIEEVASEAARAFGEDPALPELRHVLDHSRERLEEMAGRTKDFVGLFELAEPGEDEVDLVRRAGRLPQP